MQLVLKQPGELLHNLVRKSTKLLSSLAMLNNKATHAKLENAKLTQTKKMTNKVTQTKLATQRSYFYATQVRR